jgi:hypothetical protein
MIAVRGSPPAMARLRTVGGRFASRLVRFGTVQDIVDEADKAPALQATSPGVSLRSTPG